MNPEKVAIPDPTEVYFKEAVILLLQELNDRKGNENPYRNAARSLLDRLEAPYKPKLEEIPTEDETTPEIGSNWFSEWVNDTEDALDNLIPERQGRDGLSIEQADLLADAGNEILDLREECDRLRDGFNGIDRERKFWRGECDRLRDLVDSLSKQLADMQEGVA